MWPEAAIARRVMAVCPSSISLPNRAGLHVVHRNIIGRIFGSWRRRNPQQCNGDKLRASSTARRRRRMRELREWRVLLVCWIVCYVAIRQCCYAMLGDMDQNTDGPSYWKYYQDRSSNLIGLNSHENMQAIYYTGEEKDNTQPITPPDTSVACPNTRRFQSRSEMDSRRQATNIQQYRYQGMTYCKKDGKKKK